MDATDFLIVVLVVVSIGGTVWFVLHDAGKDPSDRKF
jgi:hypothetical protein